MLDKSRSRYVRSKIGMDCRTHGDAFKGDTDYDGCVSGGRLLIGYGDPIQPRRLGSLLKASHFTLDPLATPHMEDAVQDPRGEPLGRVHEPCKRLHHNQASIPING